MARVVEVPAAATHELRRQVLRGGAADAEVRFPEDERPGTFHLGVVEGDRVVAVATLTPEPAPGRPGARAVRMRGMAVEPGRQGQGLGGRLLEAAVDRLRAAGVEVLWANARDSALGFYTARGFVVEGPGFTSIGLPHHVVVRDLAGSGS